MDAFIKFRDTKFMGIDKLSTVETLTKLDMLLYYKYRTESKNKFYVLNLLKPIQRDRPTIQNWTEKTDK